MTQVEVAVQAIASMVGKAANDALAIAIVVVVAGLVHFNIIKDRKLKRPPRSKKNPPVKPDHSKSTSWWMR